MEDNYREVKKAEPCLKLIHMDQVEVEEIEWLFYPFIPYGGSLTHHFYNFP